MKTIAVSDVFLPEAYYRLHFAAHPAFELARVLHFGVEDRVSMRETVYAIERGGPEALPLPEGLMEAVEDAEMLMVHLCPVPARLLARAKKLKCVLINRGGTENVDIEAANRMGIAVLSNPAHNANAVAEYAVALMLGVSRNVALADRELRRGVWRERFPNSGNIFEMRSLTVGLVGFGSVARLVAEKLSGFNCPILAFDPYVAEGDPDVIRLHIKMTSLNALIREADIVSLHARSSDKKPLLDAEELALLKSTAYFINTARPHLVNNDCLIALLRDHKIAGAALDVFPREPVAPNDPILALDNVIITNHRAGDTVNAYSDSPGMLLAECEKWRTGGLPRYWVNRAATEGTAHFCG